MSNVMGMDITAARDLVRVMNTDADTIGQLTARLTQQLQATPWYGPDAQRFTSDWKVPTVRLDDEQSSPPAHTVSVLKNSWYSLISATACFTSVVLGTIISMLCAPCSSIYLNTM